MQPPASVEPEAIRNLMVNYIPSTIDETQLRQLFEMYGPTESVKIVLDRETRTSKGYGFVKFRHAFSAVHAIQYLNGYPLMNKRLKVAYAKQSDAQKVLTPSIADTSNANALAAAAAQMGMMNPMMAAQTMQQMNPMMNPYGMDYAQAMYAQQAAAAMAMQQMQRMSQPQQQQPGQQQGGNGPSA